MIYLSYSMLKDFGECNRKAYYHLSGEDIERSASLVSGSFIHRMIEEYETTNVVDGILKSYKRKLALALNDEKIVFYRWQSSSYFLDWMEQCYENYKAISNQLPAVEAAEQDFSIPYEDGVRVRGIFDQIREGNIICELKSSKRCPSEEYLRADLQATVYIWAYKQLYKNDPIYYYIHLPTGKVFELKRDDFTDFFGLSDEFINAVKTERWTRKQDGRKCDWCWYNHTCLQASSSSRFVFEAVGEPEDEEREERGDYFTY